jgi:predicted ATPase/DNA-binding winged helix-turn-helix (wHTH) protein
MFSFDDLTLDLRTGRLQRQSRDIALEPKAFDVLVYLVEHRGEIVPRDALMDAVWKSVHVGPHSLTQAILQLRSVLADDATEPRYIETVHRRGYRFIATVTETRDYDKSAIRQSFPARTVSLIGRDDLLRELALKIAEVRLLSLTGPGGVGKTQLALELARQIESKFDDATLVDLSPVEDGDDVARAVGLAFGAADATLEDMVRRIAAVTRGRRVLLVLDNCERVADACRAVVEPLLEACAQLRIVITSQRALQARDETIVHVPPLAVPATLEADPQDHLRDFAENPSVKLFVRRARAVAPSFTLAAENAPAVGQICRSLDGVPLAIELAAARMRVLSAPQIAERLEDRFRLLASGHETHPSRHETLAATLAWSVSLLNADENEVLARLAVFSGGWTLEAAADVAAPSGNAPILDLLQGLVDKSLVIADTNATEARYRMLETVRLHSQARLDELPIAPAVRMRHVDYFVRRAEQASPEMCGPNRAAATRFFEQEAANLREALACSSKTAATLDAELRLAVAMRWYWLEHGTYIEALDWLNRGIRGADAGATALVAKARGVVGLFVHHMGDFEAAKIALRACVHELPDDEIRERAFALGVLGFVEAIAGDRLVAEETLTRALALAEELGDDWLIGYATLGNGVLNGVWEQPSAAVDILERACAHLVRSAEPFMLMYAQVNQGLQCYLANELGRANRAFISSLHSARQLKNIRAAAGCIEGLAYVAVSEGDPARGAQLMGAASRVRALTRCPLFPQWNVAHRRNRDAIDAQLGRDLADRERVAGAEFVIEDLIDTLLATDAAHHPTTNSYARRTASAEN